MKKLFVLAACAMALVSCGTSKKSADSNVPTTFSNPVEQRAQELRKDGYKVTGPMSTFTIEECLQMYRDKVSEPDRYIGLQGVSEGAKMTDLISAKRTALADAASTYAAQSQSEIDSKLVAQFGNIVESSRIKIMGAFAQKVQSVTVSNLKEYITLYRVVPTKSAAGNAIDEYQVISYYIIDTQAMTKLKQQALEETLKETAAEQVFGDSVMKWLNEQYN